TPSTVPLPGAPARRSSPSSPLPESSSPCSTPCSGMAKPSPDKHSCRSILRHCSEANGNADRLQMAGKLVWLHQLVDEVADQAVYRTRKNLIRAKDRELACTDPPDGDPFRHQDFE